MAREPTKTLLDRIEKEEQILYGLMSTFGELRAFAEALTKRVGQSTFVIANLTIWKWTYCCSTTCSGWRIYSV